MLPAFISEHHHLSNKDKMFNNGADLGPLTSISASPPESASKTRIHVGNHDRSSFYFIMDDE
jgi:serine/arginine repetitive matrix protein 2